MKNCEDLFLWQGLACVCCVCVVFVLCLCCAFVLSRQGGETGEGSRCDAPVVGLQQASKNILLTQSENRHSFDLSENRHSANALARLTPGEPQQEIMHIVCSVILRPGQHLAARTGEANTTKLIRFACPGGEIGPDRRRPGRPGRKKQQAELARVRKPRVAEVASEDSTPGRTEQAICVI